MDYKKILPNKKLRLKLLGLLNFIPDKEMIKLQYRIKTNRSLNLKNPKRYTEKIQWYKLYYRDSLMSVCSDKYLVRDYVKNKGLSDILNPLYGVYDDPKDINFSKLPQTFAIKHNNGSGKNIFVQDKDKINQKQIIEQVDAWMNEKFVNYGREWAYNNIKPTIIIEKLLARDENNDIPDYKFFCFNGRVEYLYTMIDYTDNHEQGKCSFFTPEFEKLPYRRSEFPPIDVPIEKPKNFEKMKEIAEILSEDFPHVRVDLYNTNGNITFGELTFYNAGGYTVFDPDKFDFIMGEKFELLKFKY